jgi:glycosyltransferase involved in cell wall biosynthesis
MKKNNLVLIFRSIEQEHLGKDVFLVPYYLGKIFNMNVSIVYSQTDTNKILPRDTRGVRLIPLKNFFSKCRNEILRNLVNAAYILFHAAAIEMLMQFYFSIPTAIIGTIYKKLNKKGVLYIKSDGKMGEWPLLGYYNSIYLKDQQKIRTNIKRCLYRTFLECIDIITIETTIGYQRLCSERLLDIDLKGKVRMLFNGFDKDLFDLYNIERKDYSEKENIIITVGRLGTYPKNTDMLLKAVEFLDFRDWKIVLIGPIEKNERDFQKVIDGFYLSNEELRKHVFFTGPIYDKKELWGWYNRAKAFVLTSIYESFGIVLSEAFFFKNYIISTDVGAASSLINSSYGQIIPQNDSVYLSNILQDIIINKNNLKALYGAVDWKIDDISWENLIKDAVSGLSCMNTER